MKLLLDTHVWIWSQTAPEKLGHAALRLLLNQQHSLHLSTISTIELAQLVAIGKIQLTCSLHEWVTSSLKVLNCETIEISHAVAIEAYALPGVLHKDPADRLLVATARLHDCVLLSSDEQILAYQHVGTQDARR